MTKSILKKFIVFCFSMFLSLNLSAQDKAFDNIVVFGDSLSDTGNLYNLLFHLLPASPPYYNGRFSNGNVWVEYLAKNYFPIQHQERLHNYAVGGAEALLDENSSIAVTLSAELLDYLYWGSAPKKSSSLYIVWIGGNNYLHQPKNVEKSTSEVVNIIGDSLTRLIDKGANKFLIINLPDLSRVPRAHHSIDPTLIHTLIKAHNHKLFVLTGQLRKRYPDVTFVYMDAYALFHHAMDALKDNTEINTYDACYSGGYRGLLPTNLSDDELYADLKKKAPQLTDRQWKMIQGSPSLRMVAETNYQYEQTRSLMAANGNTTLDCSHYVFFDEIHPTTTVHEMFALYATSLIDAAGLEAIVKVDCKKK